MAAPHWPRVWGWSAALSDLRLGILHSGYGRLGSAFLWRRLRCCCDRVIVLSAVFSVHLTVRLRFSLRSSNARVVALSPDRRIAKHCLIAFSSAVSSDGAAGFGTPVAIFAALLIGIGFSPLYAAGWPWLSKHGTCRIRVAGNPDYHLAKNFRTRLDGHEPGGRPGNCRFLFSLIGAGVARGRSCPVWAAADWVVAGRSSSRRRVLRPAL